MRLGQLARKLAISPTEIVKFLESNSISASEGSNTRLADDAIRLILQQFDPTGAVNLASEQTEEPEAAPVIEETLEPVPVIEIEAAQAAITVEPAPVAEEATDMAPTTETSEASEGDAAQDQLPDVIKAPKVALAGLKVLGKIELPEPKKKEPATPENTTETSEDTVQPLPQPPPLPQPQQERRPRREGERREGDKREGTDHDGRRSRRNDGRRNEKSRKNPVAMQREREAQEAELKREAEAKAEKDRRTQHYYNRVKSVPTKPARMLREQTEEMTDDHVPTPTTWIGKFWRWFRS